VARTGTLGSLVVDISANVTNLQADVAKVQAQLNRVQDASKRTANSLNGVAKSVDGFKRLALSIVGVTAPLMAARKAVDMFVNSVEQADKIGKVAEKVGFSTDALQELRFAAKLSGVEVTALDMGLQRFSRRIGEVAMGTGELKKTAELYNIKLKDSSGQLRSNIDIFNDFADVIKNAKSEQEKLRIAFKLFDSEGAALVTMLNEGSSGVDKLRTRARELGIVLDRDLIANATEANDKLTEMNAVIGARLSQSFLKLAPAVSDFIDTWLNGLEQVLSKTKDVEKPIELPFEDVIKQAKLLASTSGEFYKEIKNTIGKSIIDANVGDILSTHTLSLIGVTEREMELAIRRLVEKYSQIQELKVPEPEIQETIISDETLAKIEQFEQQKNEIYAKYREDRLNQEIETIQKLEESEEKANRDRIQREQDLSNIKMTILRGAVDMANSLNQLGILNDRAAFLAQKGLAASQAFIYYQVAAAKAKSINPFMSTVLTAMSYAVPALIMATGFSGPGGGSGGGGGATPVTNEGLSQIAPMETAAPATQTTIIIQGNIVDHDKFARETLPAIEKALADGV